MEVNWVTGATAVGALIVTYCVYKIWWIKEQHKYFKKRGLPGPTPGLLLGNSSEFGKLGLCNALVEWNKKFGKCYGLFFGTEPVVVISDLDVVRELMVKKFAHFPNRTPQEMMQFKPWEDSLLQLRDDHWKHVRSMLSPSFSSGKLKKMMPAIDRVIENLTRTVKDKAQSGEPVELKDFAGRFTMDTIAGAAFGMHVDSLANPDEPFNTNGKDLFTQNMFLLTILGMFPKLGPVLARLGLAFIPVKPTRWFESIMEQALKQRRLEDKSYTDFLQLLIDAEKEGKTQGPVDEEINYSDHLSTSHQWNRKGMTQDEMKANGLLFFLAGYDTVSIVLSYTLYHLAAHPHLMDKAVQEVDEKLAGKKVTYDSAFHLTYLDQCVNEAMRLFPPGFMLDRQAADDVQLGEVLVKKGQRVIVPVYSIHRDPEIWEDPEKFDPDRHTPENKAKRDPFAFMPFGMGPRNCIGMRLGQLEIRMALAAILQHCTAVLTDTSVYPPVVPPPQIRMFSKDGLWVKFVPRQ